MFCIKLAELIVEIDNRHTFVEKQCRDYLCPDGEGMPAFRVRVSADEVATYRAETARPLTDGEAESFLIYRKICGEMPRYGAYLLHASVVEMDGRGYAFSARRGVGKTTHTENWLRHFAGCAPVINGDKPIVRTAADGTYWAYGTPWCGKEGYQTNRGMPLTALCFLHRGAENVVTPMTPQEAVVPIFHQVMLPTDKSLATATLGLLDDLLTKVPLYHMTCNMTTDAPRVAREAMMPKG